MATVNERFDLAGSVSARELYLTPICRWFVFPHSYGISLVNAILEYVRAGSEHVVLDPCLGAGTTLVACRAKDISALGTDILPLSLIVSKAKTRSYSPSEIVGAFEKIERELNQKECGPIETDIVLINRAFPDAVLRRAHHTRSVILNYHNSRLRAFFLTALLRCFSNFGSFSRDGGWPRLTDKPKATEDQFDDLFQASVAEMTEDVEHQPEYFANKTNKWTVQMADMRRLRSTPEVDFIITSPPYLNKHDYTRIFAPELSLSGILSNSQLISLRHRTMRSHVEGKRPARLASIPKITEVSDVIDTVTTHFGANSALVSMIAGYFEDTYAFLKCCSSKLRNAGYICLVLSNVQFDGIQVQIDDLIESMSTYVGLQLDEKWILRYRGNSSQQMAKYSRNPSREYVLFLRKYDDKHAH